MNQDGAHSELPKRKYVAPEFAASFTPSGLELPDNEEENSSEELVTEDLIGLTFAIEYLDAKKHLSKRRITVRALKNNKLFCFCHERGAHRSFRIDRIQRIYDPWTGEVDEDLESFLSKLSSSIPNAKQAKKGNQSADHIRDGARILIWLAQSDGFIAPEELDVVIDFITDCVMRLGDIDEEARIQIQSWSKLQYPDTYTMEFCAERIRNRKDKKEVRIIKHYAEKLISADGVIQPEEFEATCRLLDYLEE